MHNDNIAIYEYQQGGAMTTFQSAVFLYGECILMYNDAKNGGAIFATESK